MTKHQDIARILDQSTAVVAVSTAGVVINATAITPTSNTILLGNTIGRFVITANSINITGGLTANASLGTAGQILTTNATVAYWADAPAGGISTGYNVTTYVAPATWTKPAGLKAVHVQVQGGGGDGVAGSSDIPSEGGGAGGYATGYVLAPAIPGPIAITAGAGTNSFGALLSCTGGANGTQPTKGAPGVGSGPASLLNNKAMSHGADKTATDGGGGDTSFLGSGGVGGIQTPGPTRSGGAGGGKGAGGGGGADTAPIPNGGSGAGTDGIIIVEEYY